jgi:16S rRNA (cytidine1402-2'-O)-methyltransferase
VQEAVEKGLAVTSVPGPSAVLAALVVAGLPTDRFFFEGFLPHKSGARRARLAELAAIPGTLVFFESPRRLAETLEDCHAVLGPRDAAIARELTKFYENVRRGTLKELAAALAGEAPPKGEIVLLIGPPHADAAQVGEADLDARIEAALNAHSVKDAASVVAGETGQPRRQVYARALQLAVGRDK